MIASKDSPMIVESSYIAFTAHVLATHTHRGQFPVKPFFLSTWERILICLPLETGNHVALNKKAEFVLLYAQMLLS